MAEVQRRDDLSEELPGLLWRQATFFHQVVEQLAARHVFQHQVPAGARREEPEAAVSMTTKESNMSGLGEKPPYVLAVLQHVINTPAYLQVFLIFVDFVQL